MKSCLDGVIFTLNKTKRPGFILYSFTLLVLGFALIATVPTYVTASSSSSSSSSTETIENDVVVVEPFYERGIDAGAIFDNLNQSIAITGIIRDAPIGHDLGIRIWSLDNYNIVGVGQINVDSLNNSTGEFGLEFKNIQNASMYFIQIQSAGGGGGLHSMKLVLNYGNYVFDGNLDEITSESNLRTRAVEMFGQAYA